MRKSNKTAALDANESKHTEQNEKKVVKVYPHFTPGNTPNRAQSRIQAGVNKRGEHKPDNKQKLIVIGKYKFKQYRQRIPLKDKTGNIIGYRKIIHTQPI